MSTEPLARRWWEKALPIELLPAVTGDAYWGSLSALRPLFRSLAVTPGLQAMAGLLRRVCSLAPALLRRQAALHRGFWLGAAATAWGRNKGTDRAGRQAGGN